MDDRPPERSQGLRFTSMKRRRRSSGPPYGTIALVVLALLVVGGAAWFWLRSPDPEPTVAPAPTTEETQTATRPDAPPLDLPELDASDAFVRDIVARLSAHPQLSRWLVTEGLVHRFVGTVVNLAGHRSPATHLDFMEPEGEFRTRAVDGRLVVDPATHRRYDLLAETFASLDAEGAARLYVQLHPLFEEAYDELGFEESFDEMFERAVANVLAVRVPEGSVEVVPDEAVYLYADPTLEASTPAQKHVLRLGPENARRVQAKLAEIADELGMTPAM